MASERSEATCRKLCLCVWAFRCWVSLACGPLAHFAKKHPQRTILQIRETSGASAKKRRPSATTSSLEFSCVLAGVDPRFLENPVEARWAAR